MPYLKISELIEEAEALANSAPDPAVKERLLRAAAALTEASDFLLVADTGAAEGMKSLDGTEGLVQPHSQTAHPSPS